MIDSERRPPDHFIGCRKPAHLSSNQSRKRCWNLPGSRQPIKSAKGGGGWGADADSSSAKNDAVRTVQRLLMRGDQARESRALRALTAGGHGGRAARQLGGLGAGPRGPLRRARAAPAALPVNYAFGDNCRFISSCKK